MISDAVILSFFGLMGTLGGGYISLQQAKLAKVVNDVHTLVNSAMGLQLKVSAIALRRLAAITNEPGDIAAAELAEQALKDHERKQAIVDAEKNT